MKKGNTDPASPFSPYDTVSQYFISILFQSISVTPLQEPLYWCTNHNQCQVRSIPVKPVTSHLQDPDNTSYCLPVCPLASSQWLVYSHSSSASEPKKTSLMQFCCNISPLPVADTIIMTTVIFLLGLRWSMVVSSELKDPQTHPYSLSHVSHPVSWDHKQTCTEVKAVRIKTGYFCSSSQRHFLIKVSKISKYLSSVVLHNVFPNNTIGWRSLSRHSNLIIKCFCIWPKYYMCFHIWTKKKKAEG